MMTMKIRSFISVDVNNEEIINQIEKLQKEITDRGIKNVNLNNLHFTLKFLGDVSLDSVEEIKKTIQSINFKEFTLTLQSVGMFPTANRPRVFWIGISSGQKELEEIAQNINSALATLGYPIERKFKSHLTIARVKRLENKNLSKLKRVQHLYQNEVFGTLKINTIALKKSTLTPDGPIYETLSRFKSDGK